MATTQLVTAEQFVAMPDVPGMQLELVRGEVVAVPGANKIHSMIAGVVYQLLWAFVATRRLGIVSTDNTGYIIERGPDSVRIPDVSFIAWERISEEEFTETYWSLSPDLAVEVVSPNERAHERDDKIDQYLKAGTRLVWVLWPRQRTVQVYTPDGHIRELEADEELDGGEVLPGFRVRVGDLFTLPIRPDDARRVQ